MYKSLGPRDAQCFHNPLDGRNIFAAIYEDSSKDGLHGRGHRPREDPVSLRWIYINTFFQPSGEASLRKKEVGSLVRYNGASLA
jgi:hypothetical protein